MASRHVKTTMFLNLGEELEWPQFPNLPFRWVLFAGLGHGAATSWGWTPLHYAASNGHIAVLERLIEAKAALDAKTKSGRGLGQRIFGRKTCLRQWDLYVTKWMKCWSVVEIAFINVSMVYQDKHVALFVFATGSFPTPRCAAEK